MPTRFDTFRGTTATRSTRLLVAQSRLEGMTLITNDARLRHYEVDTLW